MSVDLSFCGAFSIHSIFVCLNAFYVLPFGAINDDRKF